MTSTQKTTIDWLRFRTRSEPPEVLRALKPLYGDLSPMLGLKDAGRGLLGFQNGCSIYLSDMPIGRIDYGGESQRGWVRVEIPGKGCEWVRDWDAVGVLEELSVSEIRRLDIALTTWDGEINHERVVKAHEDGLFTTRRPPVRQEVTSSDPRAGRTCYIGKRKSDKFFRGYEKGFEMLSKIRGPFAESVTHIDGKKVEDIYRCEIELKPVNTLIPWEVIERRDHYFSGAYPFCSEILPNVEGDILMRRPERESQVTLASMLGNCKIQYGNALYTAMHAYHGDITAVWDKIIGDKHSEALLEAGVLLVEH